MYTKRSIIFGFCLKIIHECFTPKKLNFMLRTNPTSEGRMHMLVCYLTNHGSVLFDELSLFS